MREQCIVYREMNGGCAILLPTPEALKLMTIEEIAYKDVPKGCSWRVVSVDKLPKDFNFFDAWTDDYPTETVDIDMDKAKAIHLDRLRAKRTEKFVEMGFPYRLTPEVEKSIVSPITQERLQSLRDFPQKLDLSKVNSVEELSKIIPDVLKD